MVNFEIVALKPSILFGLMGKLEEERFVSFHVKITEEEIKLTESFVAIYGPSGHSKYLNVVIF